jgi:predicted aminopeptidase
MELRRLPDPRFRRKFDMLRLGKIAETSAAHFTRTLPLLILAASLCGCQTARYYGQAVRGQCQILAGREPITEVLAGPQTTPELRDKFRLVLRLRSFAEAELGLPVNSHYLTYVDLQRPYVVWNVYAAPEFSLEPKRWWFPFVGRVKYRGYFSEQGARNYADQLRAQGYDVHMEGVRAYSTLGWFSDPVLNTFIRLPESDLAELLFHELAHQRLFISGDTDFNEAFATVAAEEGVRRWWLEQGDLLAYQEYRDDLWRNVQFVHLIRNTRLQLEALYTSHAPQNAARALDADAEAWLRQEKNRVFEQLRDDYAKLKALWGGYSGYDRWFSGPLNNARINTIAIYYELMPHFQALLRAHDGNLEAFYSAVEALGELDITERHRRLRELGNNSDRAAPLLPFH